LYGTTYRGGAGTVFKISPNGGPVKTLYSFCRQYRCGDGAQPIAGLVQATGGNFYGTTEFGGANGGVTLCSGLGCGTVFKITPSGTRRTLYSFCSQGGDLCTDGSEPYGGLVQADGNFYGTTYAGGANRPDCYTTFRTGCGTVFKITPSGTLTTLYSFCS
jgi:uncharacterized repeat protein (TIGR03803 family)